MQNKANLLDSQMNVSYAKIKNYELRTMNYEPIKTKPIKAKRKAGGDRANRMTA